VFQKPVHLDADIIGLNFTGLSASTKLALYYLSGTSAEKMTVADLTWERATGSLQCRGGTIPHFSIYGFGFTK
jgi:hypothetical protein